jgi:hypothetical protein
MARTATSIEPVRGPLTGRLLYRQSYFRLLIKNNLSAKDARGAKASKQAGRL